MKTFLLALLLVGSTCFGQTNTLLLTGSSVGGGLYPNYQIRVPLTGTGVLGLSGTGVTVQSGTGVVGYDPRLNLTGTLTATSGTLGSAAYMSAGAFVGATGGTANSISITTGSAVNLTLANSFFSTGTVGSTVVFTGTFGAAQITGTALTISAIGSTVQAQSSILQSLSVLTLSGTGPSILLGSTSTYLTPNGNGSGLTNLTGSNVTGAVPSATISATSSNSLQLGGTVASSFAQTTGSYPGMTSGTSNNSNALGGNAPSFYAPAGQTIASASNANTATFATVAATATNTVNVSGGTVSGTQAQGMVVYSPPTLFTPNSISGCIEWNDATQISGSSGVYGTYVPAPDYSTTGTNALVSGTTLAHQPLLVQVGINRRPSYQFTGNQSFASSVASGTAETVFFVHQEASEPANIPLAVTGTSGIANSFLAPNSGFLSGVDAGGWTLPNGGAVSIANQLNNVAIDAISINGSTADVYQMGLLTARGVTSGSANINNIGLTVGGTPGGGNGNQYYTGLFSELIVYNRALSGTEIAAVNSYLKNKYEVSSAPLIVQDGESQGIGTYGKGILSTGSNSFDEPWRIWSLGTGGKGTVSGVNLTSATSSMASVVAAFDGRRSDSVYNGWMLWHNDYPTINGTTGYLNTVAISGSARAAGYKVYIVGDLPQSIGGYEAERQNYLNLVAANWRSFADGFFDPRNFPVVGGSGANTNTTYFNADLRHLNSTGYAVIIPTICADINALTRPKIVGNVTQSGSNTTVSGPLTVNGGFTTTSIMTSGGIAVAAAGGITSGTYGSVNGVGDWILTGTTANFASGGTSLFNIYSAAASPIFSVPTTLLTGNGIMAVGSVANNIQLVWNGSSGKIDTASHATVVQIQGLETDVISVNGLVVSANTTTTGTDTAGVFKGPGTLLTGTGLPFTSGSSLALSPVGSSGQVWTMTSSTSQGFAANAPTGYQKSLIRVTGTLVGGTQTLGNASISGSNCWAQDNASSLTNVGSLTLTTSGTTATVNSTNVLDTSVFSLFIAP